MDDPTLKVPNHHSPNLPAAAPGLTILCHADLHRIGERAALTSLQGRGTAHLSRRELVFCRPDGIPTAPLADPYISRTPIVLAGDGRGGISIRGASLRIDGQPTDERDCSPADLDRGVVIEINDRVAVLLHRFVPGTDRSDMGIIGHSDAITAVREEIRRVADLDVPVLIRGASGTGKERVAQAIHAQSHRAATQMLSLNMGAVPPSTAASELFGHTRGAFTGATAARHEYFLRAHNGTLFLDEIGAAPMEIQGMLLRALENGEIQPLGSASLRKVDVRLLAATDLDLEAAIVGGRFRRPLLHRLGGYEIDVPPLSARRDDIARLLVHFLQAVQDTLGEPIPHAGPSGTLWLPPRTVAALVALDWPGNVRQLRNAAQQMVITARGGDALAPPPAAATPQPVAPTPPVGRRTLKDITDGEVLAALQAHRWRVHAAAAALGVSRASLYRLIERNPSIQKASDLSAEVISQALADAGGDVSRVAAALQVSPSGLRRRMRELALS